MWLLKPSESTVNLLNRNDSFKMKVKRRIPKGINRGDTRIQSNSSTKILQTNQGSEANHKLHDTSHDSITLRNNLHTNACEEQIKSPSKGSGTSQMKGVISETNLMTVLELSGQLVLPPQSFIQFSNFDASLQVFNDLLQEITTPIITVTFFQNANAESNVSQLVSELCQNKAFEYNFQGIQVSLFEYTLHQKKITMVLFVLEKLTLSKLNTTREETLFLMSMMMSSVFVYHASMSSTRDVLHKDDLGTFSYLNTLKRKLKKMGHFIKPKLLWLLQCDSSSSTDVNLLNEEFEKLLHNVDTSKDAKLKFALKKNFQQRTCYIISRMSKNDSVQDALSPEFVNDVSILRNYLANPKHIMKIPTSSETITVTGRIFIPYINQLVHALNNNLGFNPSEVAKDIVMKDARALTDQLLFKHASDFEQIQSRLPLEESTLEQWNQQHLSELVSSLHFGLTDVSEYTIRQLKIQLENSVMTDYYKLLRENQIQSRNKTVTILENLYEKLKIRIPNYRSLDQFNRDVSDMKTTYWHQSLGSEKQNIWILFYSQHIQPDSMKLRAQLEHENESKFYTRNSRLRKGQLTPGDNFSGLHRQLSISSIRLNRTPSPIKQLNRLSNTQKYGDYSRNGNVANENQLNESSHKTRVTISPERNEGSTFLAKLKFPRNERKEKVSKQTERKSTRFPFLNGNLRSK